MKKKKSIRIPKAVAEQDIYENPMPGNAGAGFPGADNNFHLTEVPPALTAAMKKQKETPAIPVDGYQVRKLSEFHVERYAYCVKCNNVFQNDVNTQHPMCPTDNVQMDNLSLEGGMNKRKNQLQRIKPQMVTAQ